MQLPTIICSGARSRSLAVERRRRLISNYEEIENRTILSGAFKNFYHSFTSLYFFFVLLSFSFVYAPPARSHLSAPRQARSFFSSVLSVLPDRIYTRAALAFKPRDVFAAGKYNLIAATNYNGRYLRNICLFTTFGTRGLRLRDINIKSDGENSRSNFLSRNAKKHVHRDTVACGNGGGENNEMTRAYTHSGCARSLCYILLPVSL